MSINVVGSKSMGESSAKAQRPEMLTLDACSPPQIEDKAEKLGEAKVHLPTFRVFIASLIAGAAIGLGGMFFAIVLADANTGFVVQRVLGGVVFSLGLTLVVIGGAELFTGNCLEVMAWWSRRISGGDVIRNWVIVWLGNLVGAVALALLVFWGHVGDLNGGAVETAFLKLAIGKIQPDLFTLFVKGILCNVLVCLAVWLTYAGHSVSDKILAMTLPVACFVAAGFEHSVANMFFLPLAWLMATLGDTVQGLDISAITLGGIVRNLIIVTLGNIVGGGLVGLVYWAVYRKKA